MTAPQVWYYLTRTPRICVHLWPRARAHNSRNWTRIVQQNQRTRRRHADSVATFPCNRPYVYAIALSHDAYRLNCHIVCILLRAMNSTPYSQCYHLSKQLNYKEKYAKKYWMNANGDWRLTTAYNTHEQNVDTLLMVMMKMAHSWACEIVNRYLAWTSVIFMDCANGQWRKVNYR